MRLLLDNFLCGEEAVKSVGCVYKVSGHCCLEVTRRDNALLQPCSILLTKVHSPGDELVSSLFNASFLPFNFTQEKPV
ncbi:hypothetical protein J2793_007454 [Paraburkholderia caledonica]|uniref:Uncharacterized protein n=1 Tax=Paraburkholderia caledonica TaxID=134536 RepID=A0AB73IPU3_9BURK|nr:hypothetical protein [Paraburkholderia caledonica]